jgi:glycine betaine/choline ABC-type transport system substrate-binding protein
MPPARPLAAPCAALACLALASCGGGPSSGASAGQAPISGTAANPRVVVVMASTRSSEQRLLSQIYAQAIEAAGFRVRLTGGLTAGAPAIAALERGRVNAYARFARVAAHERSALDRRGVTVLAAGKPVHADGLAMLARAGRRFHVTRISGLAGRARGMTLVVPRGCERQPDCLPALRRAYRLKFRSVRRVQPDLLHEALRSGRAQVALVSTTDPHIRRSGETLLLDDRGAFAAAGPVVLVRKVLEHRAGQALRGALDRADSGLTLDVMEELNARVDFDEEPAARVARDYLRATGLI